MSEEEIKTQPSESLENSEFEGEEMVDIDVTEISLDEEEIDLLIKKLQELKQTKTEFEFDIDEDNEFLFKFDESENEDDGDDSGEGSNFEEGIKPEILR